MALHASCETRSPIDNLLLCLYVFLVSSYPNKFGLKMLLWNQTSVKFLASNMYMCIWDTVFFNRDTIYVYCHLTIILKLFHVVTITHESVVMYLCDY